MDIKIIRKLSRPEAIRYFEVRFNLSMKKIYIRVLLLFLIGAGLILLSVFDKTFDMVTDMGIAVMIFSLLCFLLLQKLKSSNFRSIERLIAKYPNGEIKIEIKDTSVTFESPDYKYMHKWTVLAVTKSLRKTCTY